jgi:hypothetical protein
MCRSAEQIQSLKSDSCYQSVNLACGLIPAMPLRAWEPHAPAGGGETRLVGTVIKFPDEGRIVRFGRDADESATIIILPVIRIERYADAYGEGLEPQTQPPADNGGRRRVRRR